MSGRYAPLPTQQPSRHVNRELDEAFGSDDEDLDPDQTHSSESTPLTQNTSPSNRFSESSLKTGSDGAGVAAYDFERDFDYARPPPGSPPRASSGAVPNDIGNTNGVLPSSPVEPPILRPSFFRRAVGAILPTHYTRLPTSAGGSLPAVRGGGTENDGVFSNVTAKPSAPARVRADDGNIYMIPEEEQNVAPPSYASAQADAVPSYWETTVHAPPSLDTNAGMIIEDLPTGSTITLVANLFISFFFQFVGFLLTYLLHTTHAAKFGSRAGLGLTLIQYGFYSRTGADAFGAPPPEDVPADQLADTVYASTSPNDTPTEETYFMYFNSRDFLSFLLMTLGKQTTAKDGCTIVNSLTPLGWFIFITSLIGFWRVKHWESSIRASNAQGSPTPEEIERDIATRRHLEEAFGFPLEDVPSSSPRIPTQAELDEARLRRDLQAAGMI
ncbi:hypothetical protein F5141DRAFT_109329 [Pisolithus sp. B1]|nr:hypothetical protein F5141DRAFT_109329 [Pisolithus sp. B1]